MKVLFLGPSQSPLVGYLEVMWNDVVATMDPIDVAYLEAHSPNFIVSYGYRHILKRDVLDRYPDRVINLHASYLPWNRGADPNFWSYVEDTPKGVTIHYVDEGVDTGDIIAQRRVHPSDTDTLRTSYDRLHATIQTLFKEHWLAIRAGRCTRRPQRGTGTYHRLKDKEGLSRLLSHGCDTPVAALQEYAADTQLSAQFWETYDAEVLSLKALQA